jgi:hypothetical protein
MVLAPNAAHAASKPTDGQIEMGVVHAIDASNALKRDPITASTIQSEVTLSGTVSNEASRELAGSIVAHVPGVTKVYNDLNVGNLQEALDASTVPQVPALALQPVQQYAQEQPSSGRVTLPEGTLLQVRTSEAVDSKRARDGTPIQFTVIRDVSFGDVLAIPRGATVRGMVTEIRKSGEFGGSSEIALRLISLDLGGRSYPLQSDLFKVKGPNKAGKTARNIFGGALLGALVGGFVDRGTGAAIGAAAGAGAGTAVSAASPGPGAWIPAEALVDFRLAAPVTVTPVSPQEAMRLTQELYPGDPSLYRRGYYPYARPYTYQYAYPPVYFRPYYSVGGLYSWR